MIRVDCREGSKQYADILTRLGCPTTRTTLAYGDIAFEGSGPEGVIEVGVEVKTLGDYNASYRNHRLQRQLRGMKQQYAVSILLVTHAEQEELNPASMMSLYFQGQVLVRVEPDDGARWLATLYNWWQKPWDKHTSMKGLYLPQGTEDALIPVEPGLTRKWAACVDGIGWELSGRVAARFHSPIELANGTFDQWLDVDGIGEGKARAAVNQISGKR